MSKLLLLQEIEYQKRLLVATERALERSKGASLKDLFENQAKRIDVRIKKLKKGLKNEKVSKRSSKRSPTSR